MNPFIGWTKEMVENHNARISNHIPNGSARPAPILERPVRDEPLATPPVQETTGQRFLVRIVSYRKRLLDEDNLAEKYHIDLLRYAGILPSDTPGICKIEVSQQKSKKEYTRIEVLKL